ncbi:MAG: general secretion pathway protein K [Gammaproteobacteria bacterium]|jgi:general secretion pathway protein K
MRCSRQSYRLKPSSSLLAMRKQGGMALMFAVLIVIIASTLAVSVVYEGKFTIRKIGRIQSMDRAALYSYGFEDWARIYLKKDREDSKIDSLDEDWALGIPGLPIEGGYLAGYFEDEQSRFNLNSLLDSQLAVTRFERLCDNLEVEKTFIPALMDWIDPDFDVRYPDGAEEHYETYRVANRFMADVTELLLVQHVTPEIFYKLKPYITALPDSTTININTMSEVIFESLGEGLDASKFIEEREEEPFESVQAFIERLQAPIPIEGLSVDSKYFKAYGQVVQGDVSYTMASLMYRDAKGTSSIINRNLERFQ